MTVHEPGSAYSGPARVTGGEETWQVEVTLRAEFQPIDGRLHWYGRVAAATPIALRGGSEVVVHTTHGEATGKLSDLDSWGRPRLTGTGQPPF